MTPRAGRPPSSDEAVCAAAWVSWRSGAPIGSARRRDYIAPELPAMVGAEFGGRGQLAESGCAVDASRGRCEGHPPSVRAAAGRCGRNGYNRSRGGHRSRLGQSVSPPPPGVDRSVWLGQFEGRARHAAEAGRRRCGRLAARGEAPRCTETAGRVGWAAIGAAGDDFRARRRRSARPS